MSSIHTPTHFARLIAVSEQMGDGYPTGLGASFDIVEKLIAGNERAMLAWDKAMRGEHGGAREGAGRKPAVATPEHDPETGEIKLDNIQLEKPVSDAPTGTSAQAGLRRLEKAASAGDAPRHAEQGVSALNPPVPPAELQPWSDEDEAAWQDLHRDDHDVMLLDLDEAQS